MMGGGRSRGIISLTFWMVVACSANEAASHSPCRENERTALLEFKKMLKLDENNTISSSWASDKNCCQWYGVECNNQTGHIVELQLRGPNECLGGEMRSSLAQLKHLHHLDLSYNCFNTTKIPSFIGSLTNLSYLNLSHAGFLISSNLTWLPALTSLRYLDLSGVDLSEAAFDTFSRLPSLTVLRVSSCNLSNLPLSLSVVNLTSLTTLQLSYNKFNSIIPDWLYSLKILVSLDLSANSFHGSVSGLSDLSELKILNLAVNKFSGSIPESFGQLTELERLDLGDNLFSGSIPASLARLKSMRYLSFYKNNLTGPIPQGIGQLSDLEYLNLGSNNLAGIVSEAHFANLSKLKDVYLSSNSLDIRPRSDWVPTFQLHNLFLDSSGSLHSFPTWLRSQMNLFILDLSNAKISGTIPDWFWNVNLRYSSYMYGLNLSYNEITGSIPTSFVFYNIRTIDLSYNRFVGPLPLVSELVFFLLLANNSFSGDLSRVINTNSGTNLNVASVSGNQISGNIPSSFCEMSQLEAVDLSNNLLSGEIPNCHEVFPQLLTINLASNNFSGEVPLWIGRQHNLRSLHLNNNYFHGELPYLKNCNNLSILDLGENDFSGSIPTWFGEMSNLQILRLRSNHLEARIPDELSHMAKLQVLDLSNNNISGDIPAILGNLSAMEVKTQRVVKFVQYATFFFDFGPSDLDEGSLLVSTKGEELLYTKTLSLVVSLDLSDNNLDGLIPEELMKLQGLKTLNLSGNQLKGGIPRAINNLTQLETLDLSRNQISGGIPASMSSLTSLNNLNLSFNNLSGPIPSGNQLQVLDNPLIYAGNLYLCGYPLEKCHGGDHDPQTTPDANNNDDSDTIWTYLAAVIGYVVGFWGFFGVLIFNKSWRVTYFQIIDKIIG